MSDIAILATVVIALGIAVAAMLLLAGLLLSSGKEM